MPIRFKQKGKFRKLDNFFERIRTAVHVGHLDKYGREGVRLLSDATPKDSGLTAASWSYHIENTKEGAKISFMNENIQNGVPVAILLQYGHATRNGGWVEGVDYINPVIRPLFERIADEAWQEIKNT